MGGTYLGQGVPTYDGGGGNLPWILDGGYLPWTEGYLPSILDGGNYPVGTSPQVRPGWKGVPPVRLGAPPLPQETEHATRRAVCLLRSDRRTFLLNYHKRG